MSLDTSGLVNVRPNAEGWDCQCPICARAGLGLRAKNQLRIFKTGAFHCVLDSTPDHNRAVRAILRGYSDEQAEVIYVEPKLTVDAVYPESTLVKLVPDYDYWVGRGMKESALKALENGVAPADEKSKLSGRSIFPLRNPDRTIVGFSGRLLEDRYNAPKWKHLARIKTLVYPWHVSGAAIKETKACMLVESIGDLLACQSYGIVPVLCIFGLNLSAAIISTLLEHDVRRVIISLNRDDDPNKGQAAAAKISDKLVNFFPEVSIKLPPAPHKDWGDAAQAKDEAAFARFKEENNL